MRMNKSDYVFQLAMYHKKKHGMSSTELKQMSLKELKELFTKYV